MSNIELGSTVAWHRDYITSSNALSKRIVWGTVIGKVEKPGSMGGFPMQGTYLKVRPLHSMDLPFYIHESDAMLVHAPAEEVAA